MKNKTFYISTPIYYTSGNLHIGHVYTTTIAWALRNYKKMLGYDTLFLTGSDEHGLKIQKQAILHKLEPQKYVDKLVNDFQKLWKDLDIDYDLFSRTTSKNHQKAVLQQFAFLKKQGIIYKGKYKGLYSVQDEEFLTETQAIKKNGHFFHPLSNHLLEEIEEETYFLKITAFQDWLKNYIESHYNFIFPQKIWRELKNNFFQEGLKDLSITRNTFDWGIHLDDGSKDVIYVWLDALNNYLTSLGYHGKDEFLFQKFWVNGDEIVHVLGKEIARFHAIYWPIILKAANLRQPTTLIAHGWIITSDGKMSKSKNNVIDPYELLKDFSPEVIKYFFASQIKIGDDGVFSKELLINVYNNDLVNNFGNLVSRTLTLINKKIDPLERIFFTFSSDLLYKKLLNDIETHVANYHNYLKEFKLSWALKEAMLLGNCLNGFIEKTSPWNYDVNSKEIKTCLAYLLNGIYAMATMLKIVIPQKIEELKEQLNISDFDFGQIFIWKKFDQIRPEKKALLFPRHKTN